MRRKPTAWERTTTSRRLGCRHPCPCENVPPSLVPPSSEAGARESEVGSRAGGLAVDAGARESTHSVHFCAGPDRLWQQPLAWRLHRWGVHGRTFVQQSRSPVCMFGCLPDGTLLDYAWFWGPHRGTVLGTPQVRNSGDEVKRPSDVK